MNSADMITTDTESQMLFVISVSFIAILSLFVLVSTGSIVAVLVLWVLSALLILVLIYYGFIDVEKILGALKAEKPKKEEPKPADEGKGGGPSLGSEVFYVVYDKNFTYEEAPDIKTRVYEVEHKARPQDPERTVYTTTEEVLANPESRDRLIAEAIRAAMQFRRRFKMLHELDAVMEEIDKAVEKLGAGVVA
jgi:hypothetical protein